MESWTVLLIGFGTFGLGIVVGWFVKHQAGLDTQKALSYATEELSKRTTERLAQDRELDIKELNSKKELIDDRLARMTDDMQKMEALITGLEKERSEQYGKVGERLREVSLQTAELTKTTNNLTLTLSSTSQRGQWGERMAEQLLALMGLKEGINYTKQVYTISGQSRPDFSFHLPNGLKVNMDVKFPWDNYRRYVEADGKPERERYLKTFLGDFRKRVKELQGRDYISHETVDCVLLFIPNEQIFAFVMEQDQNVLDEALSQKVVLCSPATLFAVLAIVRQAVRNFQLERSANELLQLMQVFHKKWEDYQMAVDGMGKKLADAQKAFDTLTGTKSRTLDAQMAKINQLQLSSDSS